MIGNEKTAEEKRAAFRLKLAKGGLMRFPGAFAPLVAMLVEQAGFETVFIGGFGFYVCYRQKAMLRQAGGYDVGFGSRNESWSTPQTGPGFFARRRMRRTETARRRTAERQRMLEAEIDRVLDKVHHQGLGSLTSKEKWVLQQGTKKQKTGR